jgi:N-acetylneuraminic acid mutarotase
MAQPRGFGSIATLLRDGTVLLAGGDRSQVRDEIYDPGAGTWTPTRSMADWRFDFSATLLRDGRVLVAGGRTAAGVEERLATAELYDPATGRWTATGTMTGERGGHTATLLPGGRVLVTGGHVYSGDPGGRRPLTSSELYDPATGRWTATGSLVTARGGHVATLLPSGKVVVAGGASLAASTLASAELYDPANGRWTATGTMIDERYGPAIVGLPDGTVLVIGGQDSDTTAKTAERYDPDSGRWTATGSLDEGRHSFTASLLTDGRVLVAGGRSADRFGIALASAELYDPLRGRWTPTASMEAGRIYAAATVLDDGTVLVAGGAGDGWLTSAERYDRNGGA